ncbi:copper chaperone PCu(A)C [Streptomyces sp. NBC_00448]|uniref:copper chaperone PCu(A)C n=1 Tax=Streptomyces sp. NBC_00448 TaxID=2903652 RepID=UPI002E22D0F5
MKSHTGTPARAPHFRRRVVPLLRGAAVPLGAAAVALFALAVYAASGAAGAPDAVMRVSGARILLPTTSDATAAFVTLRNTGGSADTLTGAGTPWGTAMLAHTVVASNAGHMEALRGLTVGPGQTFTMAAETTDLMVPTPPSLTVGQHVRLTLEFAGSGPVTADAVVVRAGD